jgi:uncharacterized protein GlcG (DUF336 family)
MKTRPMTTISVESAEEMIAAAAVKAEEIGKPMVISIVDPGGDLIALRRMDGAPLLSLGLSQDKAYTAVSFGLPSHQWFDFIKEDDPLRIGIVHTPRLVVFGGGYPILDGDALVGGIGVSGGHYSDDMQVAEAALAAVA